MTNKPDDLEAVRTIVAALEPFEAIDQERILRWSREKLGLTTTHTPTSSGIPATPAPPATSLSELTTTSRSQGSAKDIRSFIDEKAPSSDRQFAAAVAYYYRFEAPEEARKDSITKDDLQEACRLAGRTRLAKPAQTLINAHHVGLLDKADRGAYAISTVGENLVAVALPSAGTNARPVKKPSSSKGKAKSSAKKSRKRSKG